MDQGISTSMDQLVGLLEANTAIKVGDAAKQLKVEKELVESWAKMLAKAEVIRIHYSVIGGAVLKKGPKFETIVRKAAVAKVPITSLPETEEVQADVQAPIKKVETKAPPITKITSKSYILIKKKIEEEEQTIERELMRLREEQTKIVACMSSLVEEGNKLTEYIESLRLVAEETKNKVGKKATKKAKASSKS